MATWTLNWRRGPLTLEVPDDRLRQVVELPSLPTLGTPRELVDRALAQPIGCPPLPALVRPGDRVALLVTDMHDRIVGDEGGVGAAILDHLNRCGVADDRVTLIHAAGMHGHQGARGRLGPGLLGRVRYVEHDPTDEASLRFLGPTLAGTLVWVNREVAEADLVLGIGGCGPSLFGFQGGSGIILPGVAGRDTIRMNHSKIATVRAMPGWGPGNPMREDVHDAADLARLRLKIDFTANTVLAGYFREEWPIAVRYVQEHLMTPVAPADVFVLGVDSAELPGALYMRLEFAEQVTRPGGVIVVVCSAAGHTALVSRPLAEVLAETVYITEQWIRETGEEGDPAVRAYWRKRDTICKEELLCRSWEELSRVVARRQGEPRTTTMAWSHRRCLEARRVLLVSEGVTPEEGALMGFAATTDSFDAALAQALDLAGPGARVVANVAPRLGYPRPVAA